jgi:uncharacterized membrane protein YbhN (UPF0104 family)
VAIPFSLAPRLLQPLAWAALLRAYGAQPPHYPQLTLIYAKSWLARYIPGKVSWLGAKVLLGVRHGINAHVLAITSVAEAGIQVAVAMLMACAYFAVGDDLGLLGPELRWFAALSLGALAIGLSPPVFNTVVARVQSMVAKDQQVPEHRLSVGPLLGVAGFYAIIHTLNSVPLYLLLKAVYAPLSLAHFPFLAAAYLLAGAIGAMAQFAPSGIGVREGVMLVLLVGVLPREIAVLAVVFLRLWSMAADLVFYVVAEALERTHRTPVLKGGSI